MLKVRLILIALLCSLLISPFASAENQVPARQGTAADWAGVLSSDTIKDIDALSQRLKNAAGGKIYVVTRHFLGGADALAYGQYLFDAWELGEMDALLLMVIGEENYTLVLGNKAEKLAPAESRNSLLAQYFRSAYLARDYNGAVAGLLPALSENISRAVGKTVDTAGLFGQMQAQATARPAAWNHLWNDMFTRPAEENETDWIQEQAQEETQSNWRTVVIWGLVIYFLFFRKKKRRFNFGRPPKGRR